MWWVAEDELEKWAGADPIGNSDLSRNLSYNLRALRRAIEGLKAVEWYDCLSEQ